MTVAENSILGYHDRPPAIKSKRALNLNLKKIAEDSEQLVEQFDIRTPGVQVPAGVITSYSIHYTKLYDIALPGGSILDHFRSQSVKTTAVGKIGDIFNQQGIDSTWPDKGNPACLDRTAALLSEPESGNEFIFVNLVA